MACQFDDVGIMISLVSEPDEKKFDFIKGIRNSFNNYINDMERNIHFEHIDNVKLEWNKYLYKPFMYYIFGQYDTAIISFTDDFDFNVRSFRPFDPILDEFLTKKHFNNKVIIGPTPKFKENRNILTQTDHTFLSKDKPYISITQIKLNNELLIRAGTTFLRAYIKSVLRLYQNHYKERYKPFKILILESFAWSEVTLLIFSDSFNKMQDFIIDVRDIDISQMNSLLDGDSDRTDKNEFFENISRTHMSTTTSAVITSKSIFGYRMELYEYLLSENNDSSLYDSIDPEDKISPITRWQIRPGYTETAIKKINYLKKESESLKEELKNASYNFCVGKSDLIFPHFCEPQLSRKYIRMLAELENTLTENHILQSPSTIIRTDTKKTGHEVKEKIYLDNAKSDRDMIEMDDIISLNNKCKELRIRKSTSIRMLNMISNYNCGINDETAWLNFIELRPFLNSFVQSIIYKWESLPNSTVDYEGMLYTFCDCFESAWKNRYHSSYRFSDITDFNIDFKGGIQQIAAALDSVFKTLSKRFHNNQALLAITGDKARNINEKYIYMEIDYMHMYEPSYFWVIAANEAATSFFINEKLEIIKEISREIDNKKNVNHIFDKKSIKRNVLFHYIETSTFFQYLFRDLISYYVSFLGDDELYSFWTFNYFLTTAQAKDIVTRLNFLIRFQILSRYIKEEKNIDFYKKYIEDGFLYMNEVSVVIDFVEELFKNEEFTEWYNKANKIATRYSKGISASDIDKKEINKTQAIIEKGEIVPYDRFSESKSIIYLQKLFYSYLLMLKDNFNKNKLFVSRDIDGDVYKTETDENCSCEFDERGGFLIFSGKARREHFKHRNSIMMSLLNYSLKSKIKYVK